MSTTPGGVDCQVDLDCIGGSTCDIPPDVGHGPGCKFVEVDNKYGRGEQLKCTPGKCVNTEGTWTKISNASKEYGYDGTLANPFSNGYSTITITAGDLLTCQDKPDCPPIGCGFVLP